MKKEKDKIVNLRINVSQLERTLAKGAAGLVLAGSLFGGAWFFGGKVVEGFANAVETEYQAEQLEDAYYKETLGGNPNHTNIRENYDVYEMDGNTVLVPKDEVETTSKRSR